MTSTYNPSLSSSTTLTSPPSKTFSIKPSSTTKNALNIYDATSSSTVPIYILTTSKSSPQLTLTLPTSTSHTAIGTATFHRFTNFNTDISLPAYSQKPVTIHPSTTTYSHEFHHPKLGSMKWGLREDEKGRSKDLHLTFLKDEKVVVASLEAPREMGREGSRLVMRMASGGEVRGMKGEVVDDEEVERFVVLSACAVGWRGHGKADVLGAAVGFGAVGIRRMDGHEIVESWRDSARVIGQSTKYLRQGLEAMECHRSYLLFFNKTSRLRDVELDASMRDA